MPHGSMVKLGNQEGFMELADDIYNCKSTLRATGRLNDINNEDCLVEIVARCPSVLKSHRQSKVHELRQCGHKPNIDNVRKLVRMVAVEKNDPVFGASTESVCSNQTARDKCEKRPGQSFENKHASFNIQTT